jgi:hypothetical protein
VAEKNGAKLLGRQIMVGSAKARIPLEQRKTPLEERKGKGACSPFCETLILGPPCTFEQPFAIPAAPQSFPIAGHMDRAALLGANAQPPTGVQCCAVGHTPLVLLRVSKPPGDAR